MERCAKWVLSGITSGLISGLAIGLPMSASANTEITPEVTASSEQDGMAQITSVSQLRDVQPTDWAFQALQSLVERYGCLSGYPNATFQGNRSLSRFEFAAGLNACIDAIQTRINADSSNYANNPDLDRLKQLQQEFSTELTALRGRIDILEAKTTTLSNQAFSTTTQLYGQTILGLQASNRNDVDFFPRDGQPERQGEAKPNFGYNLQLSLATSFRGNDLLLMGMQAGNIRSNAPDLFSNMGRIGYESETAGQLFFSDLSYRFSFGPNLGVIVGPVGVNAENTFRGINPLEGNGEGALSLLAQRNPILNLGNTTGGIGFDWQINNRISLQGIYSTALAAQPTNDRGLFGDGYTIGAQLTLAPTEKIDIGINYLYSHSPDGVIGLGVGDSQLLSPFTPDASAFNTHAIGATLAWRINPNWTIGTWGGWTKSNAISLDGTVETTNWMAFSAFPDLLIPGNLGGIMIGQPPKITSSNLPDGFNFPRFSTDATAGGQPDSAIHLEAFYRAKLTSKISVTPGLLVILNPNHNKDNEAIVQGVLRTTYQF